MVILLKLQRVAFVENNGSSLWLDQSQRYFKLLYFHGEWTYRTLIGNIFQI
jgi:hypothetical protein